MTPSERADAEHLRQWVEAEVGGTVTRIERLARWRPAWDIDVDLGGGELPLHARGEREANFAIPYRIADEVPTHDLLEAAGLPVPHAFGLCPQPYALVMDRLPGFVDLSFAADDAERRALLDEYLRRSTASIWAPPRLLGSTCRPTPVARRSTRSSVGTRSTTH